MNKITRFSLVFSLVFCFAPFANAEYVEQELQPTQCQDEITWGDYSYYTLAETRYQDAPSSCSSSKQCDNTWQNDKENFNVILTPDGSHYDQNIITHILFHPISYYDRAVSYRSIIRKIDPDNDDRIPLIIIHGIDYGEKEDPLFKASGLAKCRSVEKHYAYILNDNGYFRNLYEFITSSDIKNKYRVYFYSYPTYKHITYNARMLSNLLGENDYIRDWINNGKKIAIVAHSMGGLVARSMLEEHGGIQQNGTIIGSSENILAGLITLGTPHHGSPAAMRTLFDAPDEITGLNRKIPGSQDLYWDNYDKLLNNNKTRTDLIRNTGFPVFIHSVGCPALNVEIQSWYSDEKRENNIKLFDDYYKNAFALHLKNYWCYKDIDYENYYKYEIPAYPNPWLAALNDKLSWIYFLLKPKYYFYGGNQIVIEDGVSIKNDFIADNDPLHENIPAILLYNAGYHNDIIVPVTSSLFDMEAIDELPYIDFPNGKLVGHSSMGLDGFLYNEYKYVLIENEGSPKIRFLKDYTHSRIRHGAFRVNNFDLLQSGDSGFRLEKSRRQYIIDAYTQNSIMRDDFSKLLYGTILPESGNVNLDKLIYDPLFIRINIDLDEIACVADAGSCNHSFSDVNRSDSAWFYSYLDLLKKWRVIKRNLTFRPTDPVKRAEFLKMALIAFGIAIDNEPNSLIPSDSVTSGSVKPYTDVPVTEWYAPYVYLTPAGVLEEQSPDGPSFRPNEELTREETAKILLHLMGYSEAEDVPPELSNEFIDYQPLHPFSGYLFQSYRLGILNGQKIAGSNQKRLALDELVSRAEAVKMIGSAACTSISESQLYSRKNDPVAVLDCAQAKSELPK